MVEEWLRRNKYQMDKEEVAELAKSLTDDLVSACSGKFSLQQKFN